MYRIWTSWNVNLHAGYGRMSTNPCAGYGRMSTNLCAGYGRVRQMSLEPAELRAVRAKEGNGTAPEEDSDGHGGSSPLFLFSSSSFFCFCFSSSSSSVGNSHNHHFEYFATVMRCRCVSLLPVVRPFLFERWASIFNMCNDLSSCCAYKNKKHW